MRLREFETLDRVEDGLSVSRQRAVLAAGAVPASEAGARELGAAYWRAVSRSTFGLVRPRWDGRGGELRLLRLVPLLRFGPPDLHAGGDSVSFRCAIRGGLLAARDGGVVALEQRRLPDGVELLAVVEGYRPRLPQLVHRRVQRPFHVVVSRRWLRDLAGVAA